MPPKCKVKKSLTITISLPITSYAVRILKLGCCKIEKRGAESMIDPTIIVAIIGAIATLVVGYWRFGRKAKETITFTYRGRVSNIKNDQPIRRAEVEIQISGPALIVHTDSDGIFNLQVTLNGQKNGRVKVTADGYQEYDRFIELSPDESKVEQIPLTPEDEPSDE